MSVGPLWRGKRTWAGAESVLIGPPIESLAAWGDLSGRLEKSINEVGEGIPVG